MAAQVALEAAPFRKGKFIHTMRAESRRSSNAGCQGRPFSVCLAMSFRKARSTPSTVSWRPCDFSNSDGRLLSRSHTVCVIGSVTAVREVGRMPVLEMTSTRASGLSAE